GRWAADVCESAHIGFRLLLDSRVADVLMVYNLTFVILSSLKSLSFNADFRRAKTINIFGSSREAHGYWKTTGRFRNQGIAWRGWSRAASRRIGLWQRLSKCTTIRSDWISTTPPVSTHLRYSCLGAAVSKPRSCLASQRSQP